MANPQFQGEAANRAVRSEFRGARSACAAFGRMQFGPLAASEEEAGAILEIWAIRGWHGQELTEAAATEGAVKKMEW